LQNENKINFLSYNPNYSFQQLHFYRNPTSTKGAGSFAQSANEVAAQRAATRPQSGRFNRALRD